MKRTMLLCLLTTLVATTAGCVNPWSSKDPMVAQLQGLELAVDELDAAQNSVQLYLAAGKVKPDQAKVIIAANTQAYAGLQEYQAALERGEGIEAAVRVFRVRMMLLARQVLILEGKK